MLLNSLKKQIKNGSLLQNISTFFAELVNMPTVLRDFGELIQCLELTDLPAKIVFLSREMSRRFISTKKDFIDCAQAAQTHNSTAQST